MNRDARCDVFTQGAGGDFKTFFRHFFQLHRHQMHPPQIGLRLPNAMSDAGQIRRYAHHRSANTGNQRQLLFFLEAVLIRPKQFFAMPCMGAPFVMTLVMLLKLRQPRPPLQGMRYPSVEIRATIIGDAVHVI